MRRSRSVGTVASAGAKDRAVLLDDLAHRQNFRNTLKRHGLLMSGALEMTGGPFRDNDLDETVF